MSTVGWQLSRVPIEVPGTYGCGCAVGPGQMNLIMLGNLNVLWLSRFVAVYTAH